MQETNEGIEGLLLSPLLTPPSLCFSCLIKKVWREFEKDHDGDHHGRLIDNLRVVAGYLNILESRCIW